MLTYTIDTADHCRRLESFLRTLMPQASAGYARKLIKSGAACVNAMKAAPDTFLSTGDSVTLKESAATTSLLADSRPAIDILYEDDRIVLINKPSALPMHQTAEQEANLVDLGMEYMLHRETPCKLYPVNRLDRGTSGAVILAKSSTSAAVYSRQVKETGLDKLYLALVDGIPMQNGVINTPLDDKESETGYRLLLAGSNCSLLAVMPVSGRTHQIRRHLEFIGHSVLGDKRYGGGELAGYPGFALHSFRTVLIRPESGALAVCAPLPEPLLRLCENRGISLNKVTSAVSEIT